MNKTAEPTLDPVRAAISGTLEEMVSGVVRNLEILNSSGYLRGLKMERFQRVGMWHRNDPVPIMEREGLLKRIEPDRKMLHDTSYDGADPADHNYFVPTEKCEELLRQMNKPVGD